MTAQKPNINPIEKQLSFDRLNLMNALQNLAEENKVEIKDNGKNLVFVIRKQINENYIGFLCEFANKSYSDKTHKINEFARWLTDCYQIPYQASRSIVVDEISKVILEKTISNEIEKTEQKIADLKSN